VASVVVVGASISGLNSYVIERVSKVLGVNHIHDRGASPTRARPSSGSAWTAATSG
jgi:hypothetical protein